eukprot:12911272-Prorocentrum_lima.AAC.1
MDNDPLLELDNTIRVSNAIYIDENTFNYEPLLPANACTRIIDPREMYGVLHQHGLWERSRLHEYHHKPLG